MSKHVLLRVSLSVHDGKLDAFQAIAREMVEASRKEPGTLGYEWFMSDDGKHCQLIETYVDADAVLTHFAGPAVQVGVPKLLKTADVASFQIYGEPGPTVREGVGAFGAEIFSYWHGLDR
jgi:quinol monooxygenase YgiN